MAQWLKNPPANAGGEGSIFSGLERSPGEGTGNPLQLFLPRKSHGQRSLVGYSVWGHKRVVHDLGTRQQQQVIKSLCCSSENFYNIVNRLWKKASSRVKMPVAQSCPTLCDSMNCSPPGSSVHGVLQERILEWVSISFSRRIFLTQGLNPGLWHRRQILYLLSHQCMYIMLQYKIKNKFKNWCVYSVKCNSLCFCFYSRQCF